MSVVAGPNLLLEKLAASASAPVATYPRLAALPEDLARLLRELHHGDLTAHRTARPADPSPTLVTEAVAALSGTTTRNPPPGLRASEHLSRLWARDEVERLLATPAPVARDTALRLAVHTQIVTPITGAVVLEAQAQYDAAGLTPGDTANAPSIPEPATTAAFFAATALAYTMLNRRQRRLRASPAPASPRLSTP